MEGVDLSSIMVDYAEPSSHDVPCDVPTDDQDITTLDSQVGTERSNLLTKMQLYFDVFEAKLKHIKPKSLDKLSDVELSELQKQIHYILGAKTNVEAMSKTFPMVVKAIEDLAAQFTPLRIQGTHAVCLEPDVQDMIKYTIIDSGLGGINSTPQQRLAFTLLTAAVRQHTLNSLVEAMSPEQKQATMDAMKRATKPVKTEGTTADPKFSGL